MKVVITVEKFKNIPKGSWVKVIKATKNKYIGIWGSMVGTFLVKISKKQASTYSSYIKIKMKCSNCKKELTVKEVEKNDYIAKYTKRLDFCIDCWNDYCHHAITGD